MRFDSSPAAKESLSWQDDKTEGSWQNNKLGPCGFGSQVLACVKLGSVHTNQPNINMYRGRLLNWNFYRNSDQGRKGCKLVSEKPKAPKRSQTNSQYPGAWETRPLHL